MLTPELIAQRSGTITASGAHQMMAGWAKSEPSRDYPPEIYQWMAAYDRKPLVGEIKPLLSCEVTGKTINAAYDGYSFDQPAAGLITYAEELACDELFEHDPMTDVSTKAMNIGNEREPDAAYAFMDKTGIQLVNINDQQVHYSLNGMGATPDGIILDSMDLIESGVEIKSRTPLHHARQLLINDNATLIEHDFHRFCQIQVCCRVTGADYWYSISYNPYAKEERHQLHWCVIKRDPKFIAILDQRAELVYKHKELFLNKLLAVKSPALKVAA